MKILPKLLFAPLLAALCLPPAVAGEEAGRIVAHSGEAEIIAADGSARQARRGELVYGEESLRTASGTRTQLRMSDGSMLALQADSELRIKAYQAQGGNKPASFIYELSRGGLRAIVGSGRFRLDTPLGTMASNDAPALACALDNGMYCTLFNSSATLSNQRSSLLLGGHADFDHGLIATTASRPIGLLWLPWPLSQSQAPAPGPTPSIPPAGSRQLPPIGNGLPAPRPIVITPNRRQP